MNPNHVFAGSPLDRVSERRPDTEWIEARLADPGTRVAPLWQLKPFVAPPEAPGAVWLSPDVALPLAAGGTEPIFLGIAEGVAHFALDVSGEANAEARTALAGRGNFVDLRAAAGELPAGDAAVLAQAKSLVGWHASHRFCPACGAPTEAGEAGYLRQCTRDSCRTQHFPRTDPVVIMMVVRGDRCLLGRQPRFPPEMFSALAGFVEPGESVEEAVRREVREEAGIEVGEVRYHSSQPWPFPSSLMLGCFARALTEEIRICPVELEEARWVPREDLRVVLQGARDRGLRAPAPLAIAHQLMKAWVEGAEP